MAPSVLPAPFHPFLPFDHPPTFMVGSKRGFQAVSGALEPRRHFAATDGDDYDDMFATRTSVFTTSTSSVKIAHQRPSKRKATASAISELRQLREERALLQYELDSLQLKWRCLGVDTDLLTCACTAALEKRNAKRSSIVNDELHAQMLEQQLLFADVHQQIFHGSPLLQLLRAQDVFDGLHAPLSLPNSSSGNRVSVLDAHCESALRVAPALLNRFGHPHLDKASTAVPFSHLSVMGDASHTYVANVFVCKLRSQPLDRVFRAALAACEALPHELQRCLRVQMKVENSRELSIAEQDANQLSRRSYSAMRYSNELSGVHSTQNTLFAARFADNRGVIVSDFVEHDAEQHEDASDARTQMVASCMNLMVSTTRDEDSGEDLVLLQRIVVNRYAFLAMSCKIHDDVKSTIAHLNGDLLMASVCRELQAAVAA